LKSTVVVAVITFVVFATPVLAQDRKDLTATSLEELTGITVETVVGPLEYLQKVSDAPASVTIIRADEIRLYGFRTLADVLQTVRGVSVSNDRNYSYLGLRGLSRPGDLNTRVLILVDGHRLNDNVFDSALIGTEFPIDLEIVDRVEVIRGPGTALYGTGAFAAVISIITKQGHQVRGLEASGSAGGLASRDARVTWGVPSARGVDLLLSASSFRTEGQTRLFFPEFDSPLTNNGIAENADADRSNKLAANLASGDFSAHAVYATRLKHIPTAAFATAFNDSRTRTSDERGYLDLGYARAFGRRSDVIGRVYWDRYQYDGWYAFEDDPSQEQTRATTINRDYARGTWWGAEADVAHRVSARDRLTVGVEYRRNIHQDQSNADEGPASTVYLHDRRQSAIWALNLENEFRVTRRLSLNAAARYEEASNGPRLLTPRVGVIVTPRSTTTLKFLMSEARRPPSVYERFYQSPPNYVSNPELDAERIRTMEFIVEHELTPTMRLTGSFYANRFRRMIVADVGDGDVIQFNNSLSVDARGVEVEWTARSRHGLLTRASYAALLGTDRTSTIWASSAASHIAKLNVAVPLNPLRTTAALSLQYMGARRTHTGEVLEQATVTDLTLTRPLGKRIDIQASAFNMLDAHYSDPASTDHLQGAVQQDGRTLLVRALWRLQ
jgi:iron complex outermembrane receptor protein